VLVPVEGKDALVVAAVVAAGVGDVGEPGAAEGAGDQVADGGIGIGLVPGADTSASTWIKASRLHPLIPHGTERWKAFYRQRTSVERGFGRLKTDYALTPLRVRRVARVTLHASLTILAQLASALLTTRDT
jgi:hypothetical protein